MMLPFNEYLSSIVESNKSQISSILQKKQKNSKRALTEIGGNPLGLMLSIAIPLIADQLLKQINKN